MGTSDLEDMNFVLKLNFPTCFCSFVMLCASKMHFCQKHDFLPFCLLQIWFETRCLRLFRVCQPQLHFIHFGFVHQL